MSKILLIVLGIILSSIGLSFIILYLNLLIIGYSFFDYLLFIFTHIITLLFFIGLFIIYLSIKKL